MLNWVHVWAPIWPVHDLNILLVQKGCRVTCCMGRGIVSDVHKVTSKQPRRPWQHLIPQDLDVPMPAHGCIHHDQLTPPPCWIAPHTMTDGPRFLSLGWTQPSISLFPLAYSAPEAVSEWFELTSASQIGGSSAFADVEPSWSGSFWQFGAGDGLPVAWWFSLNLHASSDVVGQALGCVAKFCLCILETPIIPATSRWELPSADLPTCQFAAVFAMANFVAWSPLRVKKNINSLYRNPKLHKSIKVVMARQTSLQVTTPELTFSFSWVSAVPRQYWLCLAIQFGYVMDRWNQQYFVPQLNIRPETVNTDQIHANGI